MRYPREVLLAIGARFAENGAFYIYSVFVLTYATQHAKLDRQMVLNGILLASRSSWSRFRSSARCRTASAGGRSTCSARS